MVHCLQHGHCLLIAQVAEITADAALQTRWIGAVLQHFRIMIKLQQQDITLMKLFDNVIGNGADIGKQPNTKPTMTHNELRRFRTVMRYRDCLNIQTTDTQALTGMKQIKRSYGRLMARAVP